MPIEPDLKDWTWVLDRPCPECGFDAAAVPVGDLAGAILANAEAWQAVLDRSDVRDRRTPDRWSDLEYGCHVRDVHRVFGERVRSMLDHDDPLFANWDQDEAAREGDYEHQDPAVVRDELAGAAEAVASSYAAVGDEQWQRTGRRSNGSAFTVASIGRYHLHDLVHHLVDVGAR